MTRTDFILIVGLSFLLIAHTHARCTSQEKIAFTYQHYHRYYYNYWKEAMVVLPPPATAGGGGPNPAVRDMLLQR